MSTATAGTGDSEKKPQRPEQLVPGEIRPSGTREEKSLTRFNGLHVSARGSETAKAGASGPSASLMCERLGSRSTLEGEAMIRWDASNQEVSPKWAWEAGIREILEEGLRLGSASLRYKVLARIPYSAVQYTVYCTE